MIHMHLYLYIYIYFFFVKKFATTFAPKNYHFVSSFTLIHIGMCGTSFDESKLEDVGANEM